VLKSNCDKKKNQPMNLYQKWCYKKADIKLKRLLKFYQKNDKILDIGSGNCALNLQTQNAGYAITGLDIANKSAFKEITPVVYDGKTLPFADNSFDVVQIITVLHHIKDPENTIKEAKRVGKTVIVMEDIYENTFQKYSTYIADSINNWEFIGHPHTNKNDKEWKRVFDQNGLYVIESEYYDFLLFFKQVTYLLNK
jgi:ubiquinone/menaquinone biosynthesis C-methylase UbiE